MNFKPLRSMFLISLTLLGMFIIFLGIGNIPSIPPIIPDAHAAPPKNPGLLGVFSELKKSSSVVDNSIAAGQPVKFDVNVTDAGSIKSFDINLTFTGATLAFSNSTYTGAKCPGCLFQNIANSKLANTTITNGYRLSVVDTDNNNPTVSGTGVLFRITFKVVVAGASPVHINSNSAIILGGSNIPYNPVDGYFDDRAVASQSTYGLSNSPTTVTIVRLVSGQSSQTATTTITTATNVGTIALKALGLPKNTVASFSALSGTCSTSCTSTLTITINGGSATGAGTTPSGTYGLAIIGNSTGTGVTGQVIKSSWLKLVVQPPAAPVFTFTTTSPLTFTQEAGNVTFIPVSVALTSGSNDSISLGTNCNPKINGVGLCNYIPPAGFTQPCSGGQATCSGQFPMQARLNVTSFANVGSGQLGTKKFNATATTIGTYSEVTVTQILQFTLNLVRTHDVAASNVAASRNFAYNTVSLSANPLKVNVTVTNFGTVSQTFTVNATAKTVLTPTTNLRWVDSGGNTANPYVAGETVVQDSEGNGLYGYGKFDGAIRFVGTGTTWVSGNPVVYDADQDGIYMVGKFVSVNDTIISGTVANNTAVKFDAKLKFIDCTSTAPAVCNNNNVWDPGETVFYDTSGNGVFDTGEPIIVGSTPTAKPVLVGTAPSLTTALSQGTLSFVDTNYNGVLTSFDVIAFDAVGDGVFESSDVVARGTAPSAGVLVGSTTVTLAAGASQVVTVNWDPGSLPRGKYLIAGAAVPVPGEFLLSNNQVIILPFTQKLKGDVSGDCKVDIVDLASVGAAFGSTLGSAAYKTNADLNNDAVINIVDLVLVAGNFGQSCPT